MYIVSFVRQLFSFGFLAFVYVISFVSFKKYCVFFRQPLRDRQLTIIAPKAEGIVLPKIDEHSPEHSGSLLTNEGIAPLLVLTGARRL